MSSIPGDWQDEAYHRLRRENEQLRAELTQLSSERLRAAKSAFEARIDLQDENERLRAALAAILSPECSGYQGAAVIARAALASVTQSESPPVCAKT